MQVSVETTGGLERRMHIQLPAAEVDKEVEGRLLSYGKTAKLKGFRPGRIPFKVIKRQFGGQIRAQVLGEIMRSSFAEAISKEKLNPAGGPRIEPSNIEEGKDLEYTAIFEVYPDIELEGLDKIKVERPKADIEDSDVDRVVENLREQRATWDVVPRAAAKGDRVRVDFAGTRDGEPFEGGDGKDVPVVIGEGQMLEDFETGLEGVEAGETREFDVRFPDDYHAEHLRGARVRFEVIAHAVEERVLPEVDDAFCATFGVEEGGVERLRADVRANMGRELEQAVHQAVKSQLMDQLFENNPIELPEALVHDETHRLQQDLAQRLGIKEPDKLPPTEVFTERARRRVGLGLLVNEIISGQGMELDRDKVSDKLAEMAADYDDPQQVMQAYRANPQLMGNVESLVLEEQVTAWLLDKAKVKDKKTSFRKLMKLDDK